jgi:hypothetical protein
MSMSLQYIETEQSLQNSCDKFIIGKSFSPFLKDVICTYKLNRYVHSDTSILALFSDNRNQRYAWFISSGLRAITERLYQETIIKLTTLNSL